MAATGYLVTYGRGSYLGRFLPEEETAFRRGQRVLVRTARGLELGEVMCPADTPFARQVANEPSGGLLRLASAADEHRESHLQLRGEELLAQAQHIAIQMGLPIALFDVEMLFDGSSAILHVVHWAECDATPLLENLSRAYAVSVKLHDDSRRPATGGCGKPGCGSEGGGCSSCGNEAGGCHSGSCSRGSVKSAEELTAYFAHLRSQMEAVHRQRHPLA